MINVREIMEKDSGVSFFSDPGYDTIAASERLAITEKAFKNWRSQVNQIQTRDLPRELIDQYDVAADAICKILAIEKEIILKGGQR